MRITIIGAGSTGTHLAKFLSGEQMDIVVVDQDADRLTLLDAEYNLMAIEGDATDFATLRQAEVGRSDLLIAVTQATERNIVICGMAKSMGAKMTVARIDRYSYLEPHNQQVLRSMGVDKAIFLEYLLARGVLSSLQKSWARSWFEFSNGMSIVALRLDADTPLAGRYLRDLQPDERFFHVIAIRRNFHTLVPKGDFQLCPHDILYVTTTSSRLRELAEMKIAYGGLANGQKLLNSQLQGAPAGSLQIPYVEIGVGIGNILRVCDLYSIWRLTHHNDMDTPVWAIRFRLNLGL